jgi:flagellar protein FlaG
MVDTNIIGNNAPTIAPSEVRTKSVIVVPERKKAAEPQNISLNIQNNIDKMIDDKFNALRGGGVQNFLSLAEDIINKTLPQQAPNTKLSIEHDDDSGRTIYKAIDIKSGEVIHQFPSEEIIKFIAYYRDKEGLVLDEEV